MIGANKISNLAASKKRQGSGGGLWVTDLTTASYDNVSFALPYTTFPNPSGITFSPDGTKMFTSCYTADRVYQHTLTTGFDLSTASYDGVALFVTSYENKPCSPVFNSDGTRLFIVGSGSDRIQQFNLSTPYNIATAVIASPSISIAGVEGWMEAIAFNGDGTKAYIGGGGTSLIHQMTLSSPYTANTASFDGVTFNCQGYPSAMSFSPDGTKMYTASLGSSVYSYTLSTGFDISTASYDGVAFDASGQEGALRGIAFNSNGSKMFLVGQNSDTVFQYTTG